MKKIIYLFAFVFLTFIQTKAQTISCASICIKDITIDTVGNNHLNVTLYNGDTLDINYPVVQVLNSTGDTIGNIDGNAYLFLQFADSTVTHIVPTALDSLPIGFTGTVYVSDGLFNTFCSFSYPMICTVGVDEISSENYELTICPNPVSSIVNIDFGKTGNQEKTINLYDDKGVLVKTFKAINNIFSFNKDGLKQGIYFVTADFNNKRLTKKIIFE